MGQRDWLQLYNKLRSEVSDLKQQIKTLSKRLSVVVEKVDQIAAEIWEHKQKKQKKKKCDELETKIQILEEKVARLLKLEKPIQVDMNVSYSADVAESPTSSRKGDRR